ncbi:MAG: twin-arginine translocase TatA/TatE family subunit [Deltaproteobacteria bacterium]|nr:twin-arginine translocase TatA/TatE family subunit [Deltaproteobacteria bacterium]
MGLPGPTELLLIFGVLVLMFGATKLPKLGGAVGESIRNFRKGIRGEEESTETPQEKLTDSSEQNRNQNKDS